jgi:hypothetical protein
MEKTKNTMERQIQELVLDYFKDIDDITVSTVVDAIVYMNPITDRKSKASEVIEKFLSDNGLADSFLKYMHDYRNESKYFLRASISDVDMIENVKRALLNLSYNRYRLLMEKKKERATNFNFMKRTLLEIFECLNNNENYIYGKEDDKKMVAKIEAMKS